MFERAAKYRRELFASVALASASGLTPTACSTYEDNLLAGSSGDAAPSVSGSGDDPPSGAGQQSSAAGASSVLAAAGAADAGEDAGAAGAIGGATSADPGGAATVAGYGGAGGTSAGGTSSGGTGGAGKPSSAGSAAVGSSGATAAPEYELIDDFEDRDAWILPVHRRNGPWYVFDDGSPGGTKSPFTIASLIGPNGRTGSTAALHFSASGFGDWGAGVGADLVNLAGKKVAYDVSAYRAVRFYAKVASGAQSTLKLLVPTTYSDPDGGRCDDAVSDKRCNDHLFCAVSALGASWAAYQCNFADLTQQGFGLVQPRLDPASVYSLQMTLSTKALAVDIWIDDLSFVKN